MVNMFMNDMNVQSDFNVKHGKKKTSDYKPMITLQPFVVAFCNFVHMIL